MTLPPFIDMIGPILRFGAENNGEIDGRELRMRLPEMMHLTSDDLTDGYESGVATKFEMYLRFAIKTAGERGLLVNRGGRRYRLTAAGLAKATEHTDVPVRKMLEAPPPEGTWFSRAYRARYRSEKEVDIRFVLPLLDHLGYIEADRADGYRVQINIGSKATRVQVDFVCFDGMEPTPSNCLLLVETKSPAARCSEV